MRGSANSAAVVIREAVSSDADSIARTFLESAAYHTRLDPERYAAPSLETISAYYSAIRPGITLVAEFSREIVGSLVAQLERSPDPMHKPMVYCHVLEIAVREQYQDQGIGARLLRAAEDWGRTHGASFASLEYHAANTRASEFYRQRMGYGLASIIAIKRL